MDEGGGQHLVVVGNPAILALPLQAGVTVDRVRGEVLGAIEGQQITVVEEDERLQGFAALELAEDSPEGGPQLFGLDVVEEGAQVGVGRDVLDAIEGAEVVIVAAFLERQEGRVFEGEEGKPAEEGVGARNGMGRGCGIRELLELVVEELDEGIAGEVFAGGEGGGGHAAHLAFCSRG
jgi:hypothetical protein